MRNRLLISTLFFFSLLFGTNVSGVISSNTTWSLANSPYLVTGNVLVNEGVTLSIEPGVIVKIEAARSILIAGELIAEGTSNEKITFTSDESNPFELDKWSWIKFASNSVDASYDASGNYINGSILSHCLIEYGGANVSNNPSHLNGMLLLDDAHPFISNCEIKYSSKSGIFAAAGTGVERIWFWS